MIRALPPKMKSVVLRLCIMKPMRNDMDWLGVRSSAKRQGKLAKHGGERVYEY
jgi:hypothetical protein